MIDEKKLRKFLTDAKRATYAAGDSVKEIIEPNGSKSLHYEDGDLRYHDNYFGGEPFGGREIVFLEGKPIWMMTYYGRVEDNVSDLAAAYVTLRKALSAIPEDNPFRGPERYEDGNHIYANAFQGEINDFFGEEKITIEGNEIYHARYAGGFICRRQG